MDFWNYGYQMSDWIKKVLQAKAFTKREPKPASQYIVLSISDSELTVLLNF